MHKVQGMTSDPWLLPWCTETKAHLYGAVAGPASEDRGHEVWHRGLASHASSGMRLALMRPCPSRAKCSFPTAAEASLQPSARVAGHFQL